MWSASGPLVRDLQRNRTNRVCLRVVGRDFKELAHAVVGDGKYKICEAGQQAGDPGKS